MKEYLHPEPLLIVLSGPSGVGKDSVIRRMRELEHEFRFVVTATDRPPRPGEVDGVDYHFVSTAEFERLIAEDALFEHARVYGQYKGVPKHEARQALASGIDVIMRLDVQGAATIRRKVPGALTIFLSPPSVEVLMARLRRRSSDSPEQVKRRLQTALAEMARFREFDYVVVNREGYLDETIDTIKAIIRAEKCRTARRRIEI
ncbi:MAG: guanylate kinase [Chloroflexi bacterium]|nr:guanylate kinase [Chloroflexota bacterium]